MKKEKAKITIKSMVEDEDVSNNVSFKGTGMNVLIALAAGTLIILERIGQPLTLYMMLLQGMEDKN